MNGTTESLALRPPLESRDPIVARVPFFYGWAMLPVAIAGQIATSPGQTYGIAAFNDSFRVDLGLTHTELTGAYMQGTVLASLPVALVGGWMDRRGIRRAMTIVVLLFGAVCIATSQVSGLVTLFLAFLLLRMLGQGALSLLSANTLPMWFHARLGTATGLMSAGCAAAIAVVPPLNLHLIGQYGWRTAYAMQGVAVWLLMLPLLAIFFRNRPEDVGQLPDGAKGPDRCDPSVSVDSVSVDAGDQATPDHRRNLTLREALRTRSYWILLSMNAIWALVGTAVMFHAMVLLESRGLTKSDAATFFTFFAVSMAAMQFIGGVLADRAPLNLLLTISMAGMGLSLRHLTSVDSAESAYVFAASFGASQGLFGVVGHTIWARYFGRAHLGKIRGTVWTACVAGSSVGPFIMGVAMDHYGVFTPALWLFAAVYALLTLAAPLVTAPREPLPAA